MTKNAKKRLRLLVLCYLAGLLVWLCVAGLRLAKDSYHLQNGTLTRQALQPGDFTLTSGVATDSEAGTFASTDPDPQFIYTPEAPEYMTRFVFKGRPLNKGGGEMVLYYTTQPGEDFSEARKLWARRSAGGEWYFDLHGKTVASLRFDPDSVGGVVWQAEGMVLNERIIPMYYFLPSQLAGVLLVVLPLLGWALICEAGAFFSPIAARRRFESRWRQLEAQTENEKD